MQYYKEIIWLAKAFEKAEITAEPSLWNALREDAKNANKIIVENKRHVYITGDQQVVFELTGLFDSIALLNDVIKLTNENNIHPALSWMDISYYPPSEIKNLPEGVRVTLFISERLPIWSRPLFTNHKVATIVGLKEFPGVANIRNINFHLIENFSYEYLLDDIQLNENNKRNMSNEQILTEVPKQYVLKLWALQEKNEFQTIGEILDEIAIYMLNTYWLQNKPEFPQWMPILLKEIEYFLHMKDKEYDIEKLIDELKVWGQRDKRVGRI